MAAPGEVSLTGQINSVNSNGSSNGIHSAKNSSGTNGKPNSGSSKSKKRRKKKKSSNVNAIQSIASQFSPKALEGDSSDIEVEYIPEQIVFDETDPLFDDFGDAFRVFSGVKSDEPEEKEQEEFHNPSFMKYNDDSDQDSEHSDDMNNTGISKKKLRKISRMSISDLKQNCKKPEVVEWVDVTASDPRLLVHLKGYRNSVPVPKHWCQKRKYLQGKRGIEKPPFELPDFIKDTGIMEMRAAARDKEDHAKAKTKARDKMQPRMGKLDIDYQRLHDAFFRFQTKPYITKFAELYYEGKEFETKLKEKKPGVLSENLKAALNIPPLAPPPWLINMQRYGPPPSYPNIIIPGLNAPIPEGAMWGYHPGGWGKPPVDEFNRPLYGDVFGSEAYAGDENAEPIDRTLWGELISDEEEPIEEEEEEEDEDSDEPVEPQADFKDGLATPSGIASVASGLETPQEIELRKETRRFDEPKQLYQVLPLKDTSVKGFMGSQFGYEIGGVLGQEGEVKRRRKMDGVEVALDPSEMSSITDKTYLASKYEGAVQERNADIAKEDLGDMVAKHVIEQERRRQAKTGKDSKDSSRDKKKGFKF